MSSEGPDMALTAIAAEKAVASKDPMQVDGGRDYLSIGRTFNSKETTDATDTAEELSPVPCRRPW